MAIAVTISAADMDSFLTGQGFQPLTIPGTREKVYGKVVDQTKGKEVCLRIYTSIDGDKSRDKDSDAIRAVLVTRVGNDTRIVGADRRVHRVAGWRKNLQDRIDGWREQLGPTCPNADCGRFTVYRTSRRGPFWGCSAYPTCYSITPYVKPPAKPKRSPKSLAAMVEAVRDRDDSDELEIAANCSG